MLRPLRFVLALSVLTPLGAALAGASGDCAAVQCRPAPVELTLNGNNADQVSATYDPAPYVLNGMITIFPGEALVFRFSGTADNPGPPVFVRAIAATAPKNVPPSDSSFQGDDKTQVQHDPKTGENVYSIRKGSPFDEYGTAADQLQGEPPGTLILAYSQAQGRPDMILRIVHNLPRDLKFDVTMERIGPRGPADAEATSTCPVRASIFGLESWPYPIGAITLRNFRFIDTSNGFNCD